jgi:hypothetical protein
MPIMAEKRPRNEAVLEKELRFAPRVAIRHWILYKFKEARFDCSFQSNSNRN